MYRDVEFGLGVLESPIHITLEGFQLPWLKTIERMGYLPNGASAIPLMLLCGIFLWVLWRPGASRVAQSFESPEMSTVRSGIAGPAQLSHR